MIVPQNRLLWLIGCTILPLTVVAAALPAAGRLTWAVSAAIAAVCLLDGLLVANRGARLSGDFPARFSITKNREGLLQFTINGSDGGVGTVQIVLGLPREVTSSHEKLRIALPPEGREVRVTWPISALRRGEHLLTHCYFRVPSRFGLWFKQGSLTAGTRICVYPDLISEQKRLAALLLLRNEPGFHSLRRVGQGRDFEKLRDYLPGDSLSDIHWKATAKRSHLVTKEYQIERTQEIYVILDASRLSARVVKWETNGAESRQEPLVERYISAALALGTVAQRHGDRFGLVTFANRIQGFVRAAANRSHFRACRDMLFNLEGQLVTPDFDELASFILLNLRRRALLLFLTSLDDPVLAESFAHSMHPVSRRHLVLVNMARPGLARPAFSDGPTSTLEDIYQRLGGHLLWHSLRELEMHLKRRGIGFSLVDQEKLCVEMVSQYITVKRRQIL